MNETNRQLARIEQPFIEAEIVDDLGITSLDMLNAFEAFLQMDVAYGDATSDTLAAYRREVGYWLQWCQESGVDPIQVRRSEVESYKESLKSKGASVATRRHKLSVIRRFYAAAQKYEFIKINPVDGVKGGKDLTLPEEKMKFLAEQALATLLSAIPKDNISGLRDRAIVALMAIHGLRRIEVHRLNHEDMQVDGDSSYLIVDGKGNKLRRVYLREDTYAAIQSYISAKRNAGYASCGALFVGHGNNARGCRLGRRALHLVVTKYLTATNLKRSGVSCHALRHTYGTLSVAGGAKIEHVRDSMGHSKLDTTSIYVKAVERAKNNPANFIDVSV